jgi:hypothetical protein
MNASWQKGSFLDNLNSAIVHMGLDNIGVAYGMAQVDWPDTEIRDRFFKAITQAGR